MNYCFFLNYLVMVSFILCFFQTFFNMGLKFGNLYKIRGIVYFRLSPHEQKAFKGFISEGVPNTIRRFHSSVYRYLPSMLINLLNKVIYYLLIGFILHIIRHDSRLIKRYYNESNI